MHYLDKVEVKIAFNQDMSFLRSLRQGTLKKKITKLSHHWSFLSKEAGRFGYTVKES